MGDLQPVIALRGVSKHFGGVQALSDVQFDIFPGEVHALLGENGAGKSTLIKIITGVHRPDTGEILLNGAPVHFADPRSAQSQGIAAIYQEPNLFPDLDIAENNIGYMLLNHGYTNQTIFSFQRRIIFQLQNFPETCTIVCIIIND